MHRLARLSVTLACVALVSCTHAVPDRPVRVRVAGGPKTGTFFILAEALASAYSRRLPDVAAEAVETGASSENIHAVEVGDLECGIAAADYLYTAVARGTMTFDRPHTHLRGVAVLYPNTLHVMTRSGSGIQSMADLAGKTIVGDFQSEQAVREQGRLDAIVGAVADSAHQRAGPTKTTGMSASEAVTALGEGRIDGATFYGGPPYQPVTDAANRYPIHLVEFDDNAVRLIKARYPFFRPAVVPAATYPGQDEPVGTVAVDNILMCSSQLPPQLVYELTRTMFEELATIAKAHPALRQIDPEQGASTPIPLHEGAARYYRERELFR